MALRSFRHAGTEWTVWDTHPSGAGGAVARAGVAAAYVHGWLTFQCEGEKRRLAPPPQEWFTLSDPQLAALLERAERVRRAPDMRF